MIRDAIVDEVRAIRDEIAKEHGYDVHKLFEAFRRDEESSTRRHVSLVSHAGDSEAAQLGNAADDHLRGAPLAQDGRS
jgi:hypothetical protein